MINDKYDNYESFLNKITCSKFEYGLAQEKSAVIQNCRTLKRIGDYNYEILCLLNNKNIN